MTDAYHLALLLASTALDACVLLIVVFAPARTPSGLGLYTLLTAACAILCMFLFKAAVLSQFGLNAFGLIHLAYLTLVVSLPVSALALLACEAAHAAHHKPRLFTKPARAALILTLTAAPVGVYASFVEPFQLQVESATLALPPERIGIRPIRVGILADLQTNLVTDYEHAAVDRLLAFQPDLILIPGDVFQGSDRQFELQAAPLQHLFQRLHAPGGCFVVEGDVDANTNRLQRVTHNTCVQMLHNQVAHVSIGDRQITLGGVGLDYNSPAALDVIAKLESHPGTEDIRILIAHRPDVALALKPGSRIDLVVAGHTHGGQIVIPGIGPILTLSHVPNNVAAGGLHAIHANPIYVSRGVGCERGQAPRIRLFCPPELTNLTLASRAQTHAPDAGQTRNVPGIN